VKKDIDNQFAKGEIRKEIVISISYLYPVAQYIRHTGCAGCKLQFLMQYDTTVIACGVESVFHYCLVVQRRKPYK